MIDAKNRRTNYTGTTPPVYSKWSKIISDFWLHQRVLLLGICDTSGNVLDPILFTCESTFYIIHVWIDFVIKISFWLSKEMDPYELDPKTRKFINMISAFSYRHYELETRKFINMISAYNVWCVNKELMSCENPHRILLNNKLGAFVIWIPNENL